MVPFFIWVANKSWSSFGARVSLVAQLVKNLLVKRPWLDFWVGKIPWRRDRLPAPVLLGFPGSSDGKESTCNVGDLSSVPQLRRYPGGGHGNLLQYSCLKNPHGQRSLACCWHECWVLSQLFHSKNGPNMPLTTRKPRGVHCFKFWRCLTIF